MKLKYLFLMLMPAVAAAQNSADSYVAEIVANNPELRASRAAATAEIINRVAENRLEATEVGFAYKWPSMTDEVTKLEFEVTQAFDWPGVYGARRRATSAARRALDARAAADERELTIKARTLLCELVCANRRVSMLDAIVANLDSLHTAMHLMLEKGESTELDHRKLRLEEVAMKQQLNDALRQRTETLSAIAVLNGGQLPAGIADLSDYGHEQLRPLEEYLAAANLAHEALAAEASARELDARAERLGLAPGFSLGYVMEKEGPVLYNGFSVGLRLPQYGAGKRAEAARLEASALRIQAESVLGQRRAEITTDYEAAVNARRLLEEYDHAFGKDYVELLQRALNGGAMSYVDYFNELNFYLAARLEYLQIQLSYNSCLASLIARRQ